MIALEKLELSRVKSSGFIHQSKTTPYNFLTLKFHLALSNGRES